MQAVKNNPRLWERVVAEVKAGDKAGPAGKWNARKAQLAVAVYKKRGGTYRGKKSPENSLGVWTREDWGYIDGHPGNRYLPKDVRDKLTPAEKAAENARKKRATAAGRQYASYADDTLEVFHMTHTSFAARKSRPTRRRPSRKSRGPKSRPSRGPKSRPSRGPKSRPSRGPKSRPSRKSRGRHGRK